MFIGTSCRSIMNKLRILHIIPNLRKGGAERLTLDICIGLSQKPNVEVALLIFDKENAYQYLSGKIALKVVPARFIPSISGKPTSELTAYSDFLNDYKPDIIHSHLFEAEMTSRQVLFPTAKYYTHLHDNMSQFRNFSFGSVFSKRALSDFYEKRILIRQYRKCNNRFIAISNHTASYFRECLPGDLAGRITILNNAIDFHRFQATPSGVPTRQDARLVTTGSLVDKKNQIFLVDVMKVLKEKGIKAHLDILGDGPNRNKIETRIHSENLSDSIVMHGNVNSVEGFLKQSHIYVHPATYEPFGLALVEAMASGLPCVMLDGFGNRDIAENGKNGFLVNKADAKDFAEKIERLVTDEAQYKKMSAYATEFASRFDIKEYTDKLLNIYNG